MSNFDIGVTHCSHQDQDVLSIKTKGVVVCVTPRCLECGAVQNEKGGWWGAALVILQLFYDGEDEFAIKCMELMDEGRKQLKIPYPIHTVEEYKAEAERIRPELDKLKRAKFN